MTYSITFHVHLSEAGAQSANMLHCFQFVCLFVCWLVGWLVCLELGFKGRYIYVFDHCIVGCFIKNKITRLDEIHGQSWRFQGVILRVVSVWWTVPQYIRTLMKGFRYIRLMIHYHLDARHNTQIIEAPLDDETIQPL
jgi:hypothetical protein